MASGGLARRFRADVRRNMAVGRERFADKMEHSHHAEAEVWLSVIGEEFGKLQRCANKLRIAQDDPVIRHWRTEGYHRIVTTSAVLARLAEEWPRLTGAAGEPNVDRAV